LLSTETDDGCTAMTLKREKKVGSCFLLVLEIRSKIRSEGSHNREHVQRKYRLADVGLGRVFDGTSCMLEHLMMRSSSTALYSC
jgi:hypothetical protein